MLELADLTAHLPPGAALWRATGGPLAWTDETAALMHVRHGLALLAWQKTKDGRDGRNAPQPPKPPEYEHEKRAREQRALARAQRHLNRRR